LFPSSERRGIPGFSSWLRRAWGWSARLQILTVAELLAGKKLEYPAHRVETFAKAERKTKIQQQANF
jgi:hypothetical protein